ncbi:hypothetical protein PINS_up004930 [Pythium insidiosum]|nr:hypothetical protein PINS_up004930 [Pythium insidiosum]
MAEQLVGDWESTDAFGNTALDWTNALKEKRVRLLLHFSGDGEYRFRLRAIDATDEEDMTSQFRHVVTPDGVFTVVGDVLHIHGDHSGISWTFQREEDETLRIRLEGAKRFGRCKGVDVIYFRRTHGSNE